MIKYKAYFYFKPSIDKVEIIRETDKYIFFKDRRQAKHSETHQYFSSFGEAKFFLYDLYLRRLKKAEESFDEAKRNLEYVRYL